MDNEKKIQEHLARREQQITQWAHQQFLDREIVASSEEVWLHDAALIVRKLLQDSQSTFDTEERHYLASCFYLAAQKWSALRDNEKFRHTL
jgi:adenosyl cobinamide kinase/adenosyl cobinamide phosphate guanylyltransferase